MGILVFVVCFLFGMPLLVGALLNSGWLLDAAASGRIGRGMRSLKETWGRSALRLLAGSLGLILLLIGLVALLAPTR